VSCSFALCHISLTRYAVVLKRISEYDEKALDAKRGELAAFVAKEVAPFKQLRGGVRFIPQIPKRCASQVTSHLFDLMLRHAVPPAKSYDECFGRRRWKLWLGLLPLVRLLAWSSQSLSVGPSPRSLSQSLSPTLDVSPLSVLEAELKSESLIKYRFNAKPGAHTIVS
jgi:hypothetical protein